MILPAYVIFSVRLYPHALDSTLQLLIAGIYDAVKLELIVYDCGLSFIEAIGSHLLLRHSLLLRSVLGWQQ